MSKYSTSRVLWGFVALITLLPLTKLANAEVTAVTEHGFVSEHILDIAAGRDRVYQALTAEIHLWWDAAHSYSGKAENFSLDARAQGCFCEKLPSGGSVQHMLVVFAEPGRRLRLSGGLGPLQAMGVTGNMDFALTDAGADDAGADREGADSEDGAEADIAATSLTYRYEVGGFTPGGLAVLAAPVDQVQLDQLMRLKAYLERLP